MNVSEQIIEVLDHLGQQLGIAIDWSSQNVLPYLQDLFSRYVSYEITMRWIRIGVLALVIAILVAVIIMVFAKEEDDEIICAVTFLAGAAIIVPLVTIGTQVANIIKLHTIPERAVLEYLQRYLSM